MSLIITIIVILILVAIGVYIIDLTLTDKPLNKIAKMVLFLLAVLYIVTIVL